LALINITTKGHPKASYSQDPIFLLSGQKNKDANPPIMPRFLIKMSAEPEFNDMIKINNIARIVNTLINIPLTILIPTSISNTAKAYTNVVPVIPILFSVRIIF